MRKIFTVYPKLLCCLLLFCLVATLRLSAQPAKQWDKWIGGSIIDELLLIKQTSNGGDMLGWYTYSGASGDRSETTRGIFNYWIKKADAAISPPSTVTLFADLVTGASGGQVIVPVRVSDFTNVLTAQGTLTFDPSVVTFANAEQFAFSDMTTSNFGTTQATNGKITFSWDDVTQNGKTLSANSVLFALRFNVVGAPGSVSPIGFSSVPVPLEFTDNTFTTLTLQVTAGEVRVPAMDITTGSITPTNMCKGSPISVTFTTSGTFNAGNVFTAQLSDGNGSFASPVNIGSVSGTTSGSIGATIPMGAAYGGGYRVRVIGSDPNISGTDNGANLMIQPTVDYYLDSDNDGYYSAISTNLCYPPFGSYQAFQGNDCNDFDNAVYPGATEVCDGKDNNCDGIQDDLVAVDAIYITPGGSTPPTSNISQSVCQGGSLSMFATVQDGQSSSGLYNYSYQWYRNGNIISGETAATYNATTAGTYFVQVRKYCISYPAAGITSNSNNITLSVNPCAITWAGTTSTNWNNASNWIGNVVPTASDNVIIPAGATRYPVLSSSRALAKDLTISSGATLTLSGGTLEVKEDFMNNGTLTAIGGASLFSGSTVQVIGGSNPSSFYNLTITSAGVSLAGPISVQRILTLNGNVVTNGNAFTLLSNANGTAMVVNNGGVVNGTATVQRYIDPSVNAGTGYRHYASPVSNTTINDLATTWFTPRVNTAYNALPTPSLSIANFPTVFAYNESRISGTYPGFGIGWESPAAISSALVPGKGYTVNIGANQTVDFMGTLNNGTVTLNNLSNGGLVNSGWHLLGNPYPSPIDWNEITNTIPVGMDEAIYAYRSSTTYGGSYDSYINGIGTGSLVGGIIPAMQAFFVRTTANVPSFSFTNAARLTSYASPSFYRTTETRPLLQLALSNAQNLKDEAFVYLESGATSGLDATFDALEMPMGTVRIFTLAGTEPLSINGLSPAPAHQQIPVVVEGVAGMYILKAEQFLNLQGYDVKLEDKQLNVMQVLKAGSVYSFSHSGGQTTSRFVLHLNAKVTGMPKAGNGISMEVFPNPNNGKFKLQLAGLKQDNVSLEVTDLVGRKIMQQDLTARDGAVSEGLALPVAKGVYLLQVKAGQQVFVRKIIVE